MINCHPNNAYLRCTTERRVKNQMNTFAVKQSNSQKRKKNSKGKIELARVSHCRGFKIFG